VSELEKIWADHLPETDAWTAAMRDVLLWRCLEESSDLALRAGDPACAAEQAERAVALRPEIGSTRFRLARALHALKRWSEAETEYRRALEDAALSTDIWEQFALLLIESGQMEACRRFLCERDAILNGCPALSRWRGTLAILQARACASPPAPSAPTRLLAHPDWRREASWQALLRAWAREFDHGDAVCLLLLVESDRLEEVVAAMELFAADSLGRTFDDMADITIIPYDDGMFHQAAVGTAADLWLNLPGDTAACPIDLAPLPLAQMKRQLLTAPHWLRFAASPHRSI
jgi:tetratricopeptide (TPR) repeat protein